MNWNHALQEPATDRPSSDVIDLEQWLVDLLKAFASGKRHVLEQANLGPESNDLMTAMLVVLCLGIALILVFQLLMAVGIVGEGIKRDLSLSRQREQLLMVYHPNRIKVALWFAGQGLRWIARRTGLTRVRAAADRVLHMVDRRSSLGREDSALLSPIKRRTRTWDRAGMGMIYERDHILVRSSSDQWRRVRRADIHDVMIERVHWWLPAASIVLIASVVHPRWWASESSGSWVFVICMVSGLLFELRRITMIYGPAGCVLRMRVPIEELGRFIDWVDDGPESPLYLDRAKAMSKGFLGVRFSAASTPAGKLHGLLHGLFSEAEIRRFVVEHYEEIVDEIPDGSSLLEIIDRVIPTLSRAGLVDRRFFAMLLQLKPQQAELIRTCAAGWGVDSDLSGSESSGAT